MSTENSVKTKSPLIAWLQRHPIPRLIIRAFIITVIMEIAGRHGVLKFFLWLGHYPHLFILNWAIVAATMSFGLLFKKRDFAVILLGVLWLALGVSNGVVLAFRITPLGAIDFKLLSSVWSIFHNYLNLFLVIVIGAAILLALFGLYMLYRKSPKVVPDRKNAVICILSMLLIAICSFAFVSESHAVSVDYQNLPSAYDKYGFSTSFLVGLTDIGIDKPRDYSDDAVDNIRDELESVPERDSTEDPDIIMVQLESFFDVNYLSNIRVSREVTPVFNSLKEQYSHGFLTVPAIGAGTANTEFEVISGMNLDYFGAGEYPYKTFLQMECCETVNYNLKTLGYTCHAVHNHNGTFYDRNVVYANLGFDTFTSIEYMDDVEENPIGWADDSVLTGEILKALDSTEGQDFVYAISVQGHGKYPTKPIEGFDPGFAVTGIEDEEDRCGFEYYLSQINGTDEFIGELISALGSRSRKTVLVLYGDHLPNLGLEEEDLTNGSRFDTEYVIWSNFDMEKEERDLYSYQLSAYVMGRLGITVGELTKLHQSMGDEESYQKDLEMLQYDMLYGDRVIYEGEDPYRSTKLQMGIDPITLNSVTVGFDGESAAIKGDGFTHWSVICVNGRRKDTTFVNHKTLLLSDCRIEPGDTVQVAQVGTDGQWLSATGLVRVKEGD